MFSSRVHLTMSHVAQPERVYEFGLGRAYQNEAQVSSVIRIENYIPPLFF